MKKLIYFILIVLLLFFAYRRFSGEVIDFVAELNTLIASEEPKEEEAAAAPSAQAVPSAELEFYTPTIESVKSPEQWQAAIANAVYQLTPSLTLKISSYSSSSYDIASLPYNLSMTSSGNTVLGTTTMTYTFDYDDNFKLIAAERCSASYNKLTAEQKAAFDALNAEADKIKSEYSTQYERELAIHDYIVLNYKYATSSYDTDRSHNVVSMLEDGTGVCQAYATMFTILGRMCDLEVYEVLGTLDGGSHEWNIVKLGDNYYHVDVTGDDPTPDNNSIRGFTYLNLTDEMINKTHTVSSKYYLPKCTSTEYNFYERSNLVVHSQEELQGLIQRKLKGGSSFITFRCEGIVIPDSETLLSYFKATRYRTIQYTGDFGKEGVFSVLLG